MVKVKICGLTRVEDVVAANAARPDFVGFVFAPSKRRVSRERAAELRAVLAAGITPVGVFVDAAVEEIVALVRGGIIDAVQLHGAEDEGFICDLRKKISVPIIKAVSVVKAGDAQNRQNSDADFLLLDHKGGGTGEVFDWGLIGDLSKPFFLAGGLCAENVADAVAKIEPFAVDVSSGAEVSPGVKCGEKMRKFVANAKGAKM